MTSATPTTPPPPPPSAESPPPATRPPPAPLQPVDPSSPSQTTPSSSSTTSSTSPPKLSHNPSRSPPSLHQSLHETPLLFPPFTHDTSLLRHLPTTLSLHAQVSSTALAQRADLHLRGSVLVIRTPAETAVLPLPPYPAPTLSRGTVTVRPVGRAALHLRPAPGGAPPLLRRLSPPIPGVLTLLARLPGNLFSARLSGRRVSAVVHATQGAPAGFHAARVLLQAARGDGVARLLAASQARGMLALALPRGVDLRTYADKRGAALGPVDRRAILLRLVQGCARVHRVGGVVGQFDDRDVLVGHPAEVGIMRFARAAVLHPRESGIEGPKEAEADDGAATDGWSETARSLAALAETLCAPEPGGNGADFVECCRQGKAAEELLAHAWVRDMGAPNIKRVRVKGVKDIGEWPRRIGCNLGTEGVVGWEFVER